MLIKQIHLEGIKNGKISLQFRKWKSASVKKGRLIKTSIGILKILEITKTNIDNITDEEAMASGFPDKVSLSKELRKRSGNTYKIELSFYGEDPRIALRENVPINSDEVDQIINKLHAMDKRSAHGHWTKKVLESIKAQPGKRAQDLAETLGVDKPWLKLNIRKLKNLGLTISLKSGYQVSKRGHFMLDRMINPEE